MPSPLPAPILSVAAEALRDVEGHEALRVLWMLFTKCKESLHDGRRLENISWRLWHRELLLEAAHADMNRKHPTVTIPEVISEKETPPKYRPPTPEDLSIPSSTPAAQVPAFSDNGSSTGSPNTNSNFDNNSDIPDGYMSPSITNAAALAGAQVSTDVTCPEITPSSRQSYPEHRPSLLIVPLSPSAPRVRRNSSVGKIICDILPHRIAGTSPTLSSSSDLKHTGSDSRSGNVTLPPSPFSLSPSPAPSHPPSPLQSLSSPFPPSAQVSLPTKIPSTPALDHMPSASVLSQPPLPTPSSECSEPHPIMEAEAPSSIQNPTQMHQHDTVSPLSEIGEADRSSFSSDRKPADDVDDSGKAKFGIAVVSSTIPVSVPEGLSGEQRQQTMTTLVETESVVLGSTISRAIMQTTATLSTTTLMTASTAVVTSVYPSAPTIISSEKVDGPNLAVPSHSKPTCPSRQVITEASSAASTSPRPSMAIEVVISPSPQSQLLQQPFHSTIPNFTATTIRIAPTAAAIQGTSGSTANLTTPAVNRRTIIAAPVVNGPPLVVVVNPTPNPTPHPTPPATPTLNGPSTLLDSVIGSKNDQLQQYWVAPALLTVPGAPPKGHHQHTQQQATIVGPTIAQMKSHQLSSLRNVQVPEADETDIIDGPTIQPPSPVPSQTSSVISDVVEEELEDKEVDGNDDDDDDVIEEEFEDEAEGVSEAKNAVISALTSATTATATAMTTAAAASNRITGLVRSTSTGSNRSRTGRRLSSKSTSSTVSAVTRTQSRSESRTRPGHSRSRSRGNEGVGAGAGIVAVLAMTRTESTGGSERGENTRSDRKKGLAITAGGTKSKFGGSRNVRAGGGLVRKGSTGARHKEKKPTFNIGSHSDEGSGVGSKSAGSGSSGSAMAKGVAAAAAAAAVGVNSPPCQATKDYKGKGKEKEVIPSTDADVPVQAGSPGYVPSQPEILMGPLPQQRQPDVPGPSNKNTGTLPSPNTVAAQGVPPPTVLPQRSRTIVLTTSESDYETYSEDDEWDDSGDEVEIPKGKTAGTGSSGAVTVGANDSGIAAGPSREGQQPQQPQQAPSAVAREAEQRRLSAQLQQQLMEQQLRQQQQQQQQQAQQQAATGRVNGQGHRAAGQNHQVTRPTAVRRSTDGNLQRQAQAAAATRRVLEQAALQAQLQQDMFSKISEQQLKQVARTRSASGLTRLLNPDPAMFPVEHPYRRGHSSCEIRSGLSGSRPPQPPSQLQQQQYPQLPPQQPPQPLPRAQEQPRPRPAEVPDQSQAQADPHPNPAPVPTPAPAPEPAPREQRPVRDPHRRHSAQMGQLPSPLPGSVMFTRLHPPKSSAAVPLATQISAGSNKALDTLTTNPRTNGHPAKAPVPGPSNVVAQPGVGGGYRPKGRPAEAELEDDSGSEDEERKLQVSMSVAQERLQALAQRGGIAPKMKREPSGPNGVVGVPPHMQLHLQQQQQLVNGNGKPVEDHNTLPVWARTAHEGGCSSRHVAGPRQPQATVPTPVPAPAPPKVLTYPYNLPLPEPPSTPRTTRRLMLQNEMPESLRRNLLWERKVSLVNLPGIRRTVSNGGSSGARGNLLGGLKPLTGVPSMVQLSAKGANKATGEAGPAGERRANGEINDEEREQEKRRIALARNHSSSGDFHLKGW